MSGERGGPTRPEGLESVWARRIRHLPDTILRRGIAAWNRHRRARHREPAPLGDEGLRRALAAAEVPGDLSDHLPTLFAECVSAGAALAVELGVRGGDSTRVLAAALERTGGALVSVDLVDVGEVTDFPRWHFVEGDSVAFAGHLGAWAGERSLPGRADLVFLDTSHAYAHTLEELRAWGPLVAPGGRLILHDTNMGGAYVRRDGTVGLARRMDGGVARALGEWLGVSFDPGRAFTTVWGEWIVRHDPVCNGLTVLERSPHLASDAGPAGARPDGAGD